MKLTSKLFRGLTRPLRRAGPRAVDALIIGYSNVMTWTVADGVLSTSVPSNPSANRSWDLTQYTLSSLCTAIIAQGYTATLLPGADGTRGAITLLDADGNGGAPTQMYTGMLWAVLDAYAKELTTAAIAITGMLAQLRVDQATDSWADEWLYNTLGGERGAGENDAQLTGRIVSTMQRVKGNNLALEQLVLDQTGLSVQVIDIDWYRGNQAIYTYGGRNWKSSQVTNSASARLYPAWQADSAVLARFGLSTTAIGTPAYGMPTNNNTLLAAMAVIMPAGATSGQIAAVMAVVNAHRVGGSIAIAYAHGT